MKKYVMGYSAGYIGQGLSYVLVSTYFVVFMTNCVGMSSTAASTIMSFSLIVEVFTGIIVGNLSDNCTSRLGKRRPYILFASITMPLILILLFHTIKGSFTLKIVYYFVLSVLFRVVFSSFEIPNNAFGTELVTGYNERIKLRTASRASSIIGNFAAYIVPLGILGLFSGHVEKAWQVTGYTVALICFASWMISFAVTREEVTDTAPKERNIFKKIIWNYLELFKLKTMKILMVYKAGFSCAFALYNVATIYYFKYVAGVGNTYTSYVYFFSVSVFILTAPFVNKTALKCGKSKQQQFMLFSTATAGLLVFLLGKQSFIGAFLFVGAFAAMQNSFWQISPALFYDIVEVDEYVYGKRRAGDVSSMVSVMGTLISAIIVQIFGIAFDLCGFDASLAVQPESAVLFLEIAYIMIPTICLFISGIALKKFPINKKEFDSLLMALELKRNGKDYSQYYEEIRKII